MKKTKLLLAAAVTATAMGTLALTSCGPKKIVVWVGEESATFYDKICQDFLAKEENADFGYQIEVKGMDTGSVAGTITTDPTKAADIYTVAHDNIGKLAAGNYAKPITDRIDGLYSAKAKANKASTSKKISIPKDFGVDTL